jgi:hypothetical protein
VVGRLLIRRIIAALAAACYALLGCAAVSGAAAGAVDLPNAHYTYDGEQPSAWPTYTSPGRAPPAPTYDPSAAGAAGHESSGTSVRLSAPATIPAYDYDGTVLLAQVDEGTSTNNEPTQRASVAANTGTGAKPLIIGENMARVRAYADSVGGHAYRPWKNDPVRL